MATNTTADRRNRRHRRATLQWLAIGIVVTLGVLAAFILQDGSGGGGGHLGLMGLAASALA